MKNEPIDVCGTELSRDELTTLYQWLNMPGAEIYGKVLGNLQHEHFSKQGIIFAGETSFETHAIKREIATAKYDAYDEVIEIPVHVTSAARDNSIITVSQ